MQRKKYDGSFRRGEVAFDKNRNLHLSPSPVYAFPPLGAPPFVRNGSLGHSIAGSYTQAREAIFLNAILEWCGLSPYKKVETTASASRKGESREKTGGEKWELCSRQPESLENQYQRSRKKCIQRLEKPPLPSHPRAIPCTLLFFYLITKGRRGKSGIFQGEKCKRETQTNTSPRTWRHVHPSS